MVVDKADYLDKMKNLLNDTRKCEKINLINVVASNSISEETRGSLKPLGTRPVMYGICKVHKDVIDNYPPFRPDLSAINPIQDGGWWGGGN